MIIPNINGKMPNSWQPVTTNQLAIVVDVNQTKPNHQPAGQSPGFASDLMIPGPLSRWTPRTRKVIVPGADDGHTGDGTGLEDVFFF